MKNIFSLVIIGAACFKLTQSFMNPENALQFLGMDVNVWLYRAIWVFAGLFSVYAIIRERAKAQ
jgi:hypothetical protein